MRLRYRFAFVISLLAPAALAQPCPDASGAALRACLRAYDQDGLRFAPARSLGYDRARDTLFAVVDLERAGPAGSADSLRDPYTGRAVALGPGDPTTTAFRGTPPFSTEHTWPQSLGANAGHPEADLHHLFPIQANVNSSRGNLPFGDVDDAITATWWSPRGTASSLAPPLALRDGYAERGGGRWEPREDRKGETARAVLYFATVYEDTVAARPERAAWFESQRATLVAWHEADPPTVAELARSARIRVHQRNENPYALYPGLAARAFGTPLPVELIAFVARADGDGVLLTWITESETNNAGFFIEHRAPGAAGFDGAGFVPGAGTTSERREYTSRMSRLIPGQNTFRLRQVDFDGATTHSGVVEAAVAADRSSLAVSPNPARVSTTVTLTLRTAGHVRVAVYDALGREVVTLHDGDADLNVNTFRLDASRLAPGVYVVRVTGAVMLTRPVVIAR